MGLDGICFERIWWDEMDLEGPMSQLDRNWNDMQNGGRNQRCGLSLGAATRCGLQTFQALLQPHLGQNLHRLGLKLQHLGLMGQRLSLKAFEHHVGSSLLQTVQNVTAYFSLLF